MFSLFLLCGTILASVSLTLQVEWSLTNIDEESLERKIHVQKRSSENLKKRSCEISDDIFGGRVNTTDRLRRLRLRMKAGGFHAYIVPSNDEHQSEYIADYDKRREFISGFSGSAGTAVVLANVAALWTDGRYFIQAEKELDCNWLLMKRNEKDTPKISDWIIQNLEAGQLVGVDPKLIPYSEWMFLESVLKRSNISLANDNSNLIDDIWDIPQGRTPESVAHITVHDIKYAGKSWEDKMKELLKILNAKNVEGTIISALDEIAWLFNLRGRDVPYTPVFKAYAFVSIAKTKIYVKKLKVTPEVQQHLCPKSTEESQCVQIEEYNQAFQDMKKMINESKKLLVSSSSSYAVVNLVPEDKRVLSDESPPLSTLKVVKNPVELAGMKRAALKDSVAIVDFIAMLENQVKGGKHWDEIKASKALSKFRREQESNQGDSFETISAFGSNAAIIHYKPQVLTNRNINTKHLYLLDTGGQYYDGTTDITRTFHFGQPAVEEIEAYTRVLMGAIDLLAAIFPENTKGIDLDIIARKHLYDVGLDYQHGTGHGIGYFLSVHEGPIYIGRRRQKLGSSLEPGMFLSDEPGYYEAGKFGIRLETMMVVVNANTRHSFNNEKFYTFEPVSFVPFEPKLIDLQLLSTKQKEWLNSFNTKVRNTVGIELKKQARDRGLRWLLSKTEPIPIDTPCDNASSSVYTCCYLTVLCFMIHMFQKLYFLKL
ncbi:xaa-Pro aminopeptidase 1 isoform X3 [Parasteatoda tepidariorum]|uniref:xaa-Pro aminopeptidase 1 isoform X2 n=1 Tax=Parasteatoda tepidariorum TaxID=114398 RepID=UPI001C718D71|nr:xaa-Pro aminopeptidase 1 isoform X1 [Parasteatoda tepidariorum]